MAKAVAIITGAARGIGKAVAQRMACNGFLVVVADRDGAMARSTTAQINCAGESMALATHVDVANSVSKLNIHRGESVVPGQPILTLADLAHLRVETTDLSERDVPKVEIGQPVTVFVKALNQRVPGLRAGMSAEVQW